MTIGQQSFALRVGGSSKAELLSELRGAGVSLNELALALFADPRFSTSATSTTVQVVQVSVAALGFPAGATFASCVERAALAGLGMCPLEVGPHLRLALLVQPESERRPAKSGCAPPGAITVASAPLDDEDETPKGFYLRRIEGTLWLRGYRSSGGHRWSPEDVFAFVRSREA